MLVEEIGGITAKANHGYSFGNRREFERKFMVMVDSMSSLKSTTDVAFLGSS